MSILEQSIKKEEYAKSLSGISDVFLSAPVFSPAGSVLEVSMQCPYEDMTPNGEHSDLLTHVSFIDSIYADGPAKAAYVNGSSSPGISDEVLLDISQNVPGFLPEMPQVQISPGTKVDVREMLRVGDVEDRGVWGFNMDAMEKSPEESQEDWNPHKEFLEFLMEEPVEKTSTSNGRKRKRKMEMVVMVDPSEHESELEIRKKSKHVNGAKVTLKEKSFICRECEESFYDGDSLLQHIAVHEKTTKKNKKELKKNHKLKDKTKNRRLYCPQCPYATDCPDDFVRHAKTHEKDKSRYSCSKCSYTASNPADLDGHMAWKHPAGKPLKKCKDGERGGKRRTRKSSPTISRSKKKKNKSVQNHTKVPNRAGSNPEERCSHSSEGSTTSVDSSQVKNLKKSRRPESSRDSELDRTKRKKSTSKKNSKLKSTPEKSHKKKSNPKASWDHRGVPQNSPDFSKPTSKGSRHSESKSPLHESFLPPSRSKKFSIEPDDIRTHNHLDGDETRTTRPLLPVKSVSKKSPSKRKTPFHNFQGQDVLIDFPKCRQMFQAKSNLYLVNKHLPDALDGRLCTENPPRGHSEPRPGVPTLSIKEEWTETEVWHDPTESGSMLLNGDVKVKLKRCPYCPALFEPGTGLSNHIRGHLHRVGVDYDPVRAASRQKGKHGKKTPPVRRIKKGESQKKNVVTM